MDEENKIPETENVRPAAPFADEFPVTHNVSAENPPKPSFGQNPDFGRTERTAYDYFRTETVSAPAAVSSGINNPAFTPAGIPRGNVKKKANISLIVLFVLCSLVGLAVMIWSISLALSSPQPDPAPEQSLPPVQNMPSPAPSGPETPLLPDDPDSPVVNVPSPGQVPEGQPLSAADVIAKVEPSVVIIYASDASGTVLSGESMGSGVILSSDGQILTNAHVVSGAKTVRVVLLDGREYPARILGADSVSDIAVLKIEASGLSAAEIGDSSSIRKGDDVIAVGHPYSDDFAYTATRGMVSNLHDDFSFPSLGLVLDVIQHDATINMGNSGGPLVNMYGQIIGINSVKISGNTYENICFAIQINFAMDIARDLIAQGSVQRPVLGVQCQTDTAVGGALVVIVAPDGPAAAAGILPGDIITKLNGERLRSTEEFISRLSAFQPGDTVKISVLRDTDPFEFDVVLTEGGSVAYPD